MHIFTYNTCTYVCITVAPEITGAPDDVVVDELFNASFTCVASGRPSPNITWWRVESGGSVVQQVTNEENKTSITTVPMGEREVTSTLTILWVNASDGGMYSCVADNEAGNTSASATLTVHGELPFVFMLQFHVHSFQLILPSPSLLMATLYTPMSSPLQSSSAQPLVS